METLPYMATAMKHNAKDMHHPQITLKQASGPLSADVKVWRLATTGTAAVVPLKQQQYPFGG